MLAAAALWRQRAHAWPRRACAPLCQHERQHQGSPVSTETCCSECRLDPDHGNAEFCNVCALGHTFATYAFPDPIPAFCVPCDVTECELCDADVASCERCIPGVVLDKSGDQALQPRTCSGTCDQQEGCQYCATDGAAQTCQRCLPGLFNDGDPAANCLACTQPGLAPEGTCNEYLPNPEFACSCKSCSEWAPPFCAEAPPTTAAAAAAAKPGAKPSAAAVAAAARRAAVVARQKALAQVASAKKRRRNGRRARKP